MGTISTRTVMSSDESDEDFSVPPEMPKSLEELFHDAVYHGKMADVKKYLAKGVAVDWTDSMGWTALMLACRQKETEIGKLLIANGANVKQVGLNHWTPLHYAAHSDDQEVIRLMIEKGADVNALTIDGRTPRDLCIKWAMKKLMYSRPEYEVEYERWLYPEKYEEEQRLKEEADKAKWEEIKARMEKRKLEEAERKELEGGDDEEEAVEA